MSHSFRKKTVSSAERRFPRINYDVPQLYPMQNLQSAHMQGTAPNSISISILTLLLFSNSDSNTQPPKAQEPFKAPKKTLMVVNS